ncbi:hypothetical protein KI387_017433, partial [Taxus chinensis]
YGYMSMFACVNISARNLGREFLHLIILYIGLVTLVLVKRYADTPFPTNIGIATCHSIFVKGDQTNFEIRPDGVEGSQLYPDVKYTTVDEFLDQYLGFPAFSNFKPRNTYRITDSLIQPLQRHNRK